MIAQCFVAIHGRNHANWTNDRGMRGLPCLAVTGASAQSLVFTTIDFPGAVLTNAQGINDQGEIVGFYTDTTGRTHGFVQSGGALDRSIFPMPTRHRCAVSGQPGTSSGAINGKGSQGAYRTTASS